MECTNEKHVFLLKRRIDLSLLRQGFHIPTEFHPLVYESLGRKLAHGESCNVKLMMGGRIFEVRMNNIDFDRHHYPNHPDLLQIRYSEKSDIALFLQASFVEAYSWMKDARKRLGLRKKMHLPAELADEVVLWASSIPGIFILDVVKATEQAEGVVELKLQDELMFETFEPSKDITAGIKTTLRMQHIRQLDRSIGDSLKRLYNYRCQLTGERIGESYGEKCIVEAHHIEYFTKSMNNDTDNIIILSPTFHRIVHQYNPRFNREYLRFEFPNGVKEAIKLDRHLRTQGKQSHR